MALDPEKETVSIKEFLLSIIAVNDKRYEQRFSDTKIAVDAALIAADKAVAAALAGQKEAVTKAEVAAEKRFESVNEFRKTLSDQQQTLMLKREADIKFDTLEKQMNIIIGRQDKAEGRGIGVGQMLGYVLGAIGIVSGLLALMSRF